MADLFLSYVEEDSIIATEIANRLENAGYSVWFYGRDSVPGVRHYDQTAAEIEKCSAFVVLITPYTIKSKQVDKEIVYASEKGKVIFPILKGITYDGCVERLPSWSMIFSASVAVPVPPEGVRVIIPSIIRGLVYKDIHPATGTGISHPPEIRPPKERADDIEPKEKAPAVLRVPAGTAPCARTETQYSKGALNHVMILWGPPVVAIIILILAVSLIRTHEVKTPDGEVVLPTTETSAGKHIQTDAVLASGEPSIELKRYYDPSKRDGGEFGNGWYLLNPYKLQISKGKREFKGLSLPSLVTVSDSDLVETSMELGEDEVLRIGYLSEDDTRVSGVYPMSDGTYSLEDSRGNFYLFDTTGRMTSVMRKNGERWVYEYMDGKPAWILAAPKDIFFDFSETITEMDVVFPTRITVEYQESTETLVFADEGKVQLGYFPVADSYWDGAYILTNLGIRLKDKHGNSFDFDSAGSFLYADLYLDAPVEVKKSIPGIAYIYGRNGKITEAIIGGYGSIRYEQNDTGVLLSRIDLDGDTESYIYDELGNIIVNGSLVDAESRGFSAYGWVLACIALLLFAVTVYIRRNRAIKLSI